MTTEHTSTDGAAQPLGVGSSEGLGPLPETALAEVRNNFLNQSRLSETGEAYWGSNWYEVRKLYTAEQMRAYGAQERAAERERWKAAVEPVLKASEGELPHAIYVLAGFVRA